MVVFEVGIGVGGVGVGVLALVVLALVLVLVLWFESQNEVIYMLFCPHVVSPFTRLEGLSQRGVGDRSPTKIRND